MDPSYFLIYYYFLKLFCYQKLQIVNALNQPICFSISVKKDFVHDAIKQALFRIYV